MCASIRFENEPDIVSIKQFQERFNIDLTLYGYDGDEDNINNCLCSIDLNKYFNDNPQHKFYYDNGEWWEGE